MKQRITDEPELTQTGYTQAVPAGYLEASDQPGTVNRLDYESEDHVRGGGAFAKTAYVYTPYGYDEGDYDTRYDIIYLMHGWGGHAGEYFDYPGTKNMYDNMIAKGDMKPSIIVSATFYNQKRYNKYITMVSTVLIVTLGLLLMTKGLKLL